MQNLLRCGMAFAIVTLLTSANLSAQDARRTTGFPEVDQNYDRLHAPPVCPVSMRAQQRAGGDTLVARNGRTRVGASHIHLTLGKSKNAATVTSAKVTVSGTGGKSRTLPAVSGGEGLSDATKTLDLNFSEMEDAGVSAEMFLAGFTSVQSIRLDSLTLSDGSVWMPSAGRVCRVAPDLMMLVN